MGSRKKNPGDRITGIFYTLIWLVTHSRAQKCAQKRVQNRAQKGKPVGTVSGLGEAAIIASINRAFAPNASSAGSVNSAVQGPDEARGRGAVLVGNGDDAAVLAANARLVLTMDTSVEGQDFMQAWPSGAETSPRLLGFKCAAQNLSDINAMGGRARFLLMSLSLSKNVAASWPSEFAAGMRQACEVLGAEGVELIGGDVSAAEAISITITAVGELDSKARPIVRNAAQPGDQLYIAGRLPGTSGTALNRLLDSRTQQEPYLEHVPGQHAQPDEDELARALEAHFMPTPPLELGPALAAAGHRIAGIDVSDGLVRDATRIAEASGVDMVLDEAAIERMAAQLGQAWALQSAEARHNVLYGGEEFNLLFTVPAGTELPQLPGVSTVRIGEVTQLNQAGRQSGIYLEGQRLDENLGFDHYSTDKP
nr:thiamine-phosphate kinase [Pseudoglutamicibacter albus]